MPDKKLQLVGFMLLKVSAIGFLLGSDGEIFNVVGSVALLVASTCFILALLKNK